MVVFKDFSRPLNVIQVLFKENLIFKDFSSVLYIQVLFKPVHAFLSSADFFSKSTFWKNSFRNTIGVSNSLDPDQARHFVPPDLVPNCLQQLSADGSSG